MATHSAVAYLALASQLEEGDVTIEKTFFRGAPSARLHLTRRTFSGLLEAMIARDDYESVATALEFNEIYVPGLQYSRTGGSPAPLRDGVCGGAGP